MDLIPHRYPFLLIDKAENFVKNESIVGIKNVTINEPFFQGHFPNNPVMPGVLIIEAMAQTAGVLVAKSLDAEPNTKGVLFTTIENVKFRKSVLPGDVLEMRVNIVNHKLSIWICEGTAYVDGKKVAEAKISAMITDIKK
jgi:3-hydroxyacyl-[acyl-carrier-protein] dehydratase